MDEKREAYNYISQITRMFDKELHKEYVFCSYLAKLLPSDLVQPFDLDNRVKLEYYRLEKTYEGAIELESLDLGNRLSQNELVVKKIVPVHWTRSFSASMKNSMVNSQMQTV